jgi:hypothetical protein
VSLHGTAQLVTVATTSQLADCWATAVSIEAVGIGPLRVILVDGEAGADAMTPTSWAVESVAESCGLARALTMVMTDEEVAARLTPRALAASAFEVACPIVLVSPGCLITPSIRPWLEMVGREDANTPHRVNLTQLGATYETHLTWPADDLLGVAVVETSFEALVVSRPGGLGEWGIRQDPVPSLAAPPEWSRTLLSRLHGAVPNPADAPFTVSAIPPIAELTPPTRSGLRQLLSTRDDLLQQWRNWGSSRIAVDLLAWLHQPVAATTSTVPVIAMAAWLGRPDLQSAFPHPHAASSSGFLNWVYSQGLEEEKWERLLPPQPERHPPTVLTRREAASICIVSTFKESSGTSSAATSLFAGLGASGLQVSSISIAREGNAYIPESPTPQARAAELFIWAINPPQCLAAMHALRSDLPANAVHVGYWWWELESPPPISFSQSAIAFREIWSGSAFATAGMVGLPVPVHKAPLVMSPTSTAPSSRRRAQRGWGRDEMVVLVRADAHSSLTRKNPIGAVEAFLFAFPLPRGKARLVIKVSNASAAPEMMKLLRSVASVRADIEIMTGMLDSEGNAELTADADVFLSLHRAEGLGLGVAEALAARTVPVVSACGGALELVDAYCAVLIPATRVPVHDDAGLYLEGTWHEPAIEAAALALLSLLDKERRSDLLRCGDMRASQLKNPLPLEGFARERMRALGHPAQRERRWRQAR